MLQKKILYGGSGSHVDSPEVECGFMSDYQSNQERELDLGKLLSTFLRYIWLIGIVACAGFFAVNAYLVGFTPDLYTASATMYVYINNPNQVNYQYTSQSDLNTAKRLMETYMVVIRSNKVMNAVAERLGSQYSAEFIASTISVGSVAGTEVMRLSSTTPIPSLSMDICNAVAEFAPAEIIRVVNAGSVEVIDYAMLPEHANDKNLLSKSLMGGIAGALLVCGMLTLQVLFDEHIYTENDLVRHLDYPMLVTIPHVKRNALCGVSSRLPKRKGALRNVAPPMVAELYKRLRVNLSFAMSGKSHNVVVVTSALPDEGKSTVSTNLAIVAGQIYRNVLYIDADMRKSGAAGQSLQIEAHLRKPPKSALIDVDGHARGLSTVLQDIDSFDDVVQHSIRQGLDLLPSGDMPANPAELLDSSRMKDLLRKLRSRYDLIIIDTPPVNMVADALCLSGQVAGAIFVARSRLSSLSEVSKALDSIVFADMPVFGFALTDARIIRGKPYYKQYKRYSKYCLNNTPSTTKHAPRTSPRGAAAVKRIGPRAAARKGRKGRAWPENEVE